MASHEEENVATSRRPTDLDLESGSRQHDRTSTIESSATLEENVAARKASLEAVGSLVIDNGTPRDGAKSRARWKSKIDGRLPQPVLKVKNKITAWMRGPQPPRRNRITPLWDCWQTLPIRMLARLPRWLRVLLYVMTCAMWVVGFVTVINKVSLPTSFGGAGTPARLDCTDNLWPSAQACGPDGRNCLPFSNYTFAFNCPAGCLSTHVLNPHSIGSTLINYRSLVIGGASDGTEDTSPAYRGDSFICGSAIHAGVIDNSKGGCGVLLLTGEKSSFGAVDQNDISSIVFDSTFPMSFTFNTKPHIAAASSTCNNDPRWNLLILSIIFTTIIGIFTTKSATFFPPVFTSLFFQIGMASDPPSYLSYTSLASTIIGRFLPAALVAALFYRYSIRYTLNHRATIEKTLFWLGPAWVGSLNNSTFDKIPLQRLTAHDIAQQPGALTALIITLIIILLIAVAQMVSFQREGSLPRLLGIYATLGISLGVLASFPHLSLRLHHYILALILLPGTATQTRLSMVAQGLLVGLFINGIARWGFDPILQTALALQGDATSGSGLPHVLDPVVNGTASIMFVWKSVMLGYDGVSVIVNDVERYRGGRSAGGVLGAGLPGADIAVLDGSSKGDNGTSVAGSFEWKRQAGAGQAEYFRFGFVRYSLFGGVAYSDFTRAGVWSPNGTWSGIPAGRTRY